MIQLNNLTKKYDGKTVVDHLDVTFKPGVVTGFLGPNGSGKSTTMKMMISLVRPTFGDVSFDGETYASFTRPIQKIGALIDPAAMDVNLTARQHLNLISTAANLEKGRVEKLLNKAGLAKVQNHKIKSFSLGMKQRLGVASALLSDPDTIIFDEPFNGLDVDGIKWLRTLLKQLAEEGKTVIVSSHLMSEIEAVADRIIIIAQGKLLADMTVEEMNQKSLSSYVYVEADDLAEIAQVLKEHHADVIQLNEGLEVRHLNAKEIGRLAHEHRIALHQLKNVQPTLEHLFTEITEGKVDYKASDLEGVDENG
ncbi:ABC transporter ATP-binding protein [Thalassobacillus sp. CUG 92003]|uniref:ABC transporter ATP-binding protein n=1 Tax=Thalassobacillus sp. CUG 92003 TaxID=2736641 RepID=UPI0015E6B5C5|nr:ATP-binding cassette domain-containing protein [Thalassobacillus sp. CUG 92003]